MRYNSSPLNTLTEWAEIKSHSAGFESDKKHLRYLIQEKNRWNTMTRRVSDIILDFSKQRMTETTVGLLLDFAKKRGVLDYFNQMNNGFTVNPTENQAAMHMAHRSMSGSHLFSDMHEDIAHQGVITRNHIYKFAEEVHSGSFTLSGSSRVAHVVVIGIGGSSLGPQFVAEALKPFRTHDISLDFVSSVDPRVLTAVCQKIKLINTLFIVSSKSFSTPEVMSNFARSYSMLEKQVKDPHRHFLAVTANKYLPDKIKNQFYKIFMMPDTVGGRFSVTSAVGVLPLSLSIGPSVVESFLQGASTMDQHALTSSEDNNLPLIAALVRVWNHSALSYKSVAIIPYANSLKLLPSHLQQLYMESNGKKATASGLPLDEGSGVVLFGEVGTDAQHSFFQMAHQGREIPIEFIGIAEPPEENPVSTSGLTQHQELWANMIAQSRALAVGQKNTEPHQAFSGNRPSTIITLSKLTPFNVGQLLSFYEAQTVMEGYLVGLNPFDQFGVELGKNMAKEISSEILSSEGTKNLRVDPATNFYIDLIS